MARTRRRSSRLGGQTAGTPEPAQPSPSPPQDAVESRQDDEKCPACEDVGENNDKVDQENWVRCDACRTWFHWRCVGEGDLEAIDKWCAPNPRFFYAPLRETLLRLVSGFARRVWKGIARGSLPKGLPHENLRGNGRREIMQVYTMARTLTQIGTPIFLIELSSC